jgi:RHS repeat-associated protein
MFVGIAFLVLSVALAGLQLPAFADDASSVEEVASGPPTATEMDSDGDGIPDRPDAVTAANAARRLGERVEDLSQRTPTTQVFANADGTWTTESTAGPVRAQDPETGEWSPIDTTVELLGGSWRPVTSLGQMSFSNGGDGPLVTMDDVSGKDLSWSWPESLPTPTVDGSTLTYHNVVPHGDLVVEALPNGFSHSVVLRQAPTQALDLPMLVDADGASVSADEDGSLSITAGQKDLVTAPAPSMWDSTGSASDSAASSAVVPVDTSVEHSGGGTSVVLSPDQGYLTDPDTTYPVTIDPTYTVDAAASATVKADSTHHWAPDPEILQVGLDPDTSDLYRALVRFDDFTFAGSTITSASLSMYAAESDTCDPVSLTVQRMTSDWDPSTVDFTASDDATSTGEATASQSAKGGPTGCDTQGWDSWDVTTIAQAWAGGADNDGLRIAATDEEADGLRGYYSTDSTDPTLVPKLTITGNQAPSEASAPVPSDSRTWGSAYYTRNGSPSWTTSATDADGANVRYTVEIHSSQSDATGTLVASCTTGYVASGTSSECTPTALSTAYGGGAYSLPNATYYVRSRADDSAISGAWSDWQAVTVNYDQPEPVEISCTSAADQHWYVTRPASTTNCTFTSPGSVQLEWSLNDVAQTTLTANSSGVASTSSIAIPTSGWTSIKVRGVSNSGMASDWAEYAFGTGTAWLTSPADGASTATTFAIGASAPTGMDSAALQWRTGSTDTWKTATEVLAGRDTWTGTVDDNGSMSSTPAITWRPAAEAAMAIPGSIQVRMHFLDGTTAYDTQTKTLTVAAHAAGVDAPTAAVGPGFVQLGTGEFEYGEADVSIGSMSIFRTHLSNADPAAGADGIFGPGWDASTGVYGPAVYTVTDQRATNASLLFTATDGTVYTYKSTAAAASNLTGDFAATGDAVAFGDTVKIDAAGVLSYTESDGTVTTFEKTNGTWLPTSTIGTGAESTTSYYYGTDGLPTWIIAPAPTGVTCTPTSLPAGCQALHLTYTTVASAQRVASIDYTAWDPKLTDTDGDASNDGLPDTGAGVTTTTVAKYAYNTNGTLQAVWDPRVADGTSALKTTYTYMTATSGTVTKTRLATITPPGLKSWQINYDTDGAVTTVTRQQDSAVGTGNATWTIKYGLKLNADGDGLPNLSAAKTAAWGQPAADAPETGAAIFTPERVPSSTPTSTDWTYASLYYWNTAGRLTNTANYGIGWQISSSRYDTIGNEIWSLTPAAKAKAISDGAGVAANSAAAADRYANFTVYNDDGDRVEAEYGPTIDATTKAGDQLTLRPLTAYVYDDEASWLAYGRPTTIPDGGYNLPVETVSTSTDETTPGSWVTAGWNASSNATGAPSSVHLYDTTQARYRYDAAVAGDPSGWTLRQATATLLQNGTGWDKSIYRYDTAGRTLQERTPQGVADNDSARWTDTVYYTADSSAGRSECRSKPQWAGLTCWQGPVAQPSTGQNIPTTNYTGYALDGSSTRAETTSGTATKVAVAQYDAAGRAVRSATTTSGTSDQSVPATTYSYSTTTGLQTTVANSTMTMTTGFDTWGRTISQTDGAGNTTTTTYDAAGQIATVDDGKGTYAYGYDQTTTAYGDGEARGLATTLDTGIGGVTLEGQYDADGNLTSERFGETTIGNAEPEPLIQSQWTRDVAGNLREVAYTDEEADAEGWASSQQVDTQGRVRVAAEPGRQQTYTYDDRGRLTQTNDQLTTGSTADCRVRQYTLTADSNRTSLASYAPTSTGACQTTTATTTSSTYDQADRITNTGYAYDDLGRTTTLAAADTASPSSGNVTAGYYANDMVATLTQGTSSQTYTLDPLGRISTTKNLTSGVSLVETTNHYTATSDNPAWTETKTRPNASTAWTVKWTRYVSGLDGGVAMVQSSTGSPIIDVYNTSGDLNGTIDLGAYYWNEYTYYNEFGTTRDGSASASRYGWLGQYQRDAQGVGGLILMGARLYGSSTGRFLSRDQIAGANDNSYVYPLAPTNEMDSTGLLRVKLYSSKVPTYDYMRFWFSKRETYKIGHYTGVSAILLGIVAGVVTSEITAGVSAVLAGMFALVAATAIDAEHDHECLAFSMYIQKRYLHGTVNPPGPDFMFRSLYHTKYNCVGSYTHD